jgi:hypothetical protein
MHEPDIAAAYPRKRRHFFLHSDENAGLNKEKHMIRNNVWMKIFTSVLLTAATALPQSSGRLPVTDAEKIADALRAGPAFITKDATLLDWPSAPGGEYRLLRKGSNEWTCLPGIPGYPHDEPGCFDPVFLRWMRDSLAGRTPQIESVGVAYMYIGAWVPDTAGKAHAPDHTFHVGPHIMIVSPHKNQDELQKLSHDGSSGMPYVAHLRGQTDLYLVMPIREWDEQVAHQ